MICYGGHPVVGFADAPCPNNPPPRAGYVIWKGAVPPALVQWAMALRDNIKDWPYGQEWTMRWHGQDVLARKDHHTWTYRGGQLLTGLCIPGVTLYRLPQPAAASGRLADAMPLDPATARPDPSLALYSVSSTPPPERTDWKLVAVTAVAAATVAGMFVLGVQAAGR
jgi:hypothetical protein